MIGGAMMRVGAVNGCTSMVMGARPSVAMTPLTEALISAADSLRMMPLELFGTKTPSDLTPLKV
eukprot:5794461-Prymnesium_polylepis.1